MLFCSTLSAQINHDGQAGKKDEVDQEREEVAGYACRNNIQRLEEMLHVERNERDRLELEKEKLRQEKEMLEEQRERERGRRFSLIAERLSWTIKGIKRLPRGSYFLCFYVEFSVMTRDRRDHLEQEVLQYRQQVSALQERLDSVTKVTDKSLSNVFLNSLCVSSDTDLYILSTLFILGV